MSPRELRIFVFGKKTDSMIKCELLGTETRDKFAVYELSGLRFWFVGPTTRDRSSPHELSESGSWDPQLVTDPISTSSPKVVRGTHNS